MSRKPWWVTITPSELVALRSRVLSAIHLRFHETLGIETEDVVHHAFTALLRNRELITPDNDGLYRYLLVAARRAALDRVKTQTLRQQRRQDIPPGESVRTPLLDILIREKKQQIRDYFDELDELDRLMVWKHVVEGQSVNAVAHEFGVGWHRVDATITRVLGDLRVLLLD